MQLFGHYDCGGTHQNPDRRGRRSPTISVAGYLASASQWYEHDRLWTIRLQKDRFAHFHMSSFMANKGIFEKCVKWSEDRKVALLNDLISIIVKNVTFGIGMAVLRADYDRLLEEEPALVPMALGRPYAFCAFRCFESGADWSILHRSLDPINYVFEEGDQYHEQILKTHSFFSKHRYLKRRYWLGSLTFDPKRNTSLQAADLLTWELNREFYRKSYPEPQYAYTRDSLVALIQRIPGDYRSYGESELKAYLQDVLGNKDQRKFFLMNIPDSVAEDIETRLKGTPLGASIVRRNTAAPNGRTIKRLQRKLKTNRDKGKTKRKT